MCCFSRDVSVADTNIFARAGMGPQQFLVYSMTMRAKQEVAMILPLPVPKGAGEKAVRFINLEGYANLFADMRTGFPPPRGLSLGGSKGATKAKSAHKLEVVKVGSFIASFVPKVADFDRLDEAFRLPRETWDKLPSYADFGFAVFKLEAGNKKIHPMAFRFPRRDPKKLFFPTVHIHDGKVHATAQFDHVLYAQGPADLMRWEESSSLADSFMKIGKTKGIVIPNEHVHRLSLIGLRKNEDILV